MTKMMSIGLFAAIVAATVGVTDLASADPPAQQSDGVCPQSTVNALEAAVAAAAVGSPARGAAQARLTDCRLRAAQQDLGVAQQDLVACTTSRGVVWTLLDECLGNIAPRAITDAECQSSCTSRGGRWENGACECVADFHHPRPGRRLPAATAACLCVPDHRRPPTTGSGGGGGGTPTVERSCPSGAVNLRGENMSGRPAPANDRDCDGWRDDDDTASYWPNPLQRDWDMDGIGDCDRDGDGDADGSGQDCDSEITDVCSENDPYRAERAVCIAIARIEARQAQPGDTTVVAQFDAMLCERPEDQGYAICQRISNLETAVREIRSDVRQIRTEVNCVRGGDRIWVDDHCEDRPPTNGTLQVVRLALLGAYYGQRLYGGLSAQTTIPFADRLGLHVFGGLGAGPNPMRDEGVYYAQIGLGLEYQLFNNRSVELRMALGLTAILGSRLVEGLDSDFNGEAGYLQFSALIGSGNGARLFLGGQLLAGYADPEDSSDMTTVGATVLFGLGFK